MLREGLSLVKALWTKDVVTFEGGHFKLRNAHCVPKPHQKPHPKITVAAMGPRMMDIAANYADVWEASYLSPEHYRHTLSGFLNRHRYSRTRNV